MTRPRSSSGTLAWTVALMVLIISIEKKPTPMSSGTDSNALRLNDSASSNRPKASPPPTISMIARRWLI